MAFAFTAIGLNITPPAYGQAQTQTVQATVPLANTLVQNTCIGETVRLDGNMHTVFHFTVDSRGGVHVSSHVNFQEVTGVGLTTGNQYNFRGANSQIQNFDLAGFPFETTFVAHGSLVSQGQLPNQIATTLVHVTINANGEVTANPVSFEIACRG